MQRLLSVLSIVFIYSSYVMADSTTKTVIVKKSDIITKTIGVKGMTCVGCEVTLEKSIKKVKGVVAVKASASAENTVIQYDKTKTDEATVTKTIEKMGYKPFNIINE